MKGKLIAIEGIDGAGKETQSKLLLKFLEEKGIPCVRLEYPDYGSPTGMLIHEYLHGRKEFNLEVQYLLHATDRVKDKERILRFLQEGRTVICDRYLTSALAHQCAQGYPLEKALKIAEILGIPKPDRVIYLRISPETSVRRKTGEKKELDRNEKDIALMERVGRFYDRLVESQTWCSWFVLDGERSIEQVFEDVKRVAQMR